MKHHFPTTVLWITLFFLPYRPPPLSAQVVLDGTMGAAGALAGPDYAVTADLGTRAGGNLFHSFLAFSVNTGEKVTFSGPGSVTNIIGRVTGGNASWIDGIIRSAIHGADLFLINPAGIAFGPNASLDISGSFHTSTADYLAMSDGTVFSATNPEKNLLTTATPAAFGFLTDNPAGIEIKGGLFAPEKKDLSVIGGDLALTGATLVTTGGSINIGAVASAGELPLATMTTTDFAALGEIDMTPGTSVLTYNGGDIHIRGENFFIAGAAVWTNTFTGLDGGNIDIQANRTTVGRDGSISSYILPAASPGSKGGDLLFSGDTLTVDGGKIESRNLFGAGKGGSVIVNTQAVEVIGGETTISADTFGSGNAGEVVVNTDTLTITKGGQISSDAIFSAGKGGNVSIAANKYITVSGSEDYWYSSISAKTSGSGHGGTVQILTPELRVADGAWITAAANGTGNAGNIAVTVGNLSLTGGGQINASTDGTGRGGDIGVQVSGTLHIDGAWREDPAVLSAIASRALHDGDAGNIAVSAGQLELADKGIITASTKNTGHGGDIAVTVNRMEMAEGSAVSTASTGTGRAGTIMVQTADTVHMRQSRITSAAEHADGGDITVNAANMLLIDGSDITTSVKGGGGNGGNIAIDPEFVILRDGSRIIANAWGGSGGNIHIRADHFFASPDSVVDASSALGIDGTVAIDAPDTDIALGLAILPESFLDAGTLLATPCDLRTRAEGTSLVISSGLDGVPPGPGDHLQAEGFQEFFDYSQLPMRRKGAQ